MSINTKPTLREERVPGFVEVAYHGYMLRQARSAATNSNDPDRQVGCVLTLGYGEAVRSYRTVEVVPLMGVGYNTIPDGVPLADKAEHVVHAEKAAVLDYEKVKRANHDTFSAYITRMPCLGCAQHLANAHVKTVYFDAADERGSKWYNSFVSASRFLINEGIALIAVSDTEHGFGTWQINSHTELTVMFSEIANVQAVASDGITYAIVSDEEDIAAEREREAFVDSVYDRARDVGGSAEDYADAEAQIAEYDAKIAAN